MLRLSLLFFFPVIIIFLTPFLPFGIASGNSISNESMNYKTSVFGCEKYGDSFHCDLFKNAIEGNGTSHKSKQIINMTREPMYVNGKFDKAIKFIDKYREYLAIPQNDLYDSPQFSISFWIMKINESDPQNPHAHVISHISRDKTQGWFFDTNSSQDQSIRFSVSNNRGNITTSANMPISNSSFTNIAATFDGAHIGIYRNGNLFETIDYHGNYSASHDIPIHIGSAAYCDSCLQFSGIVDDVRLYDRAISKDTIKQIYLTSGKETTNSYIASINKSLTGHWTFDNTLNDSSPTKNTAKMFTLITSMVSASDGRIFISEKNTGKILIMKDEKILDRPFALINDSYVNWEQGLLGLALDPQFDKNHFVYLYYAAINSDGNPINRVIRFTDKENVGTNMTITLDNIPASHGYHSGGAMAFGPDNKLYITIGDATEHLYAQSLSVLVGKILRINSDGSIPKDNPFTDSPVYTLGHRNMFGIAFDDKDKIGIVTENGDVLYDEINIIHAGGNYGFPTLQPANINPQLSNSTLDIKPLRTFWHPVGPTQAIYYTGDRFPNLKNTFLYGTFTGHIYSFPINNVTGTIDSEQNILINHYPFESIIGITQTPSGDIYYGSYHIYKLVSVLENTSKQILFPIGLNYSKNIVIDNVQANIGKYIIVDLRYIDNPTLASSTSHYLKIKIPKSIIDVVKNVNASVTSSKDETIQKTIPFSIDKSTLKYNDITIPLTFTGNKLEIIINNNNSTSSYR